MKSLFDIGSTALLLAAILSRLLCKKSEEGLIQKIEIN